MSDRKNPNALFAKKLKAKTSARPNHESRLSMRQHAALRLNHLARVALYKASLGQMLDPEAWMFIAANYLSSFPPDLRGFRLNVATLRRAMADCGFDADEITDEIERQTQWTLTWRSNESKRLGRPHYIPVGADEAGEILGITEEERRVAQSWQIGWQGGSPQARRQAERQADKERHEIARRQAGAVSRKEYEAASASQQKPWEAEGAAVALGIAAAIARAQVRLAQVRLVQIRTMAQVRLTQR
ncbi:hypothetical protein CWB41_15890 [Methylovirgula ligni]|nr:hypothetical protein CWB41_15890 [Methylovirgula ligni]